jgi:hypothetical protein
VQRNKEALAAAEALDRNREGPIYPSFASARHLRISPGLDHIPGGDLLMIRSDARRERRELVREPARRGNRFERPARVPMSGLTAATLKENDETHESEQIDAMRRLCAQRRLASTDALVVATNVLTNRMTRRDAFIVVPRRGRRR